MGGNIKSVHVDSGHEPLAKPLEVWEADLGECHDNQFEGGAG
jgi:hypothetical protein